MKENVSGCFFSEHSVLLQFAVYNKYTDKVK